MPKYSNSGSETYSWSAIQRPDGRTLELAPGEEVDLLEPVVAAHLEPADHAARQFADALVKWAEAVAQQEARKDEPPAPAPKPAPKPAPDVTGRDIGPKPVDPTTAPKE